MLSDVGRVHGNNLREWGVVGRIGLKALVLGE